MRVPALDYLDQAKGSINQMSPSPLDPKNGMLVRNAKRLVEEAANCFVPTEEIVADRLTIERAIKAFGHSYELSDPSPFYNAKAEVLRAIDALEVSLTMSKPSDVAITLGLA